MNKKKVKSNIFTGVFEVDRGGWTFTTCQESNHIVARCKECGAYWVENQSNFKHYKRLLKSKQEKFDEFKKKHWCEAW